MASTLSYTAPRPWEDAERSVATVVVASDGTEQSDGAVRVALARAAERHARLVVLTVATEEPLTAPDVPYALWSEANLLRRDALREDVEAQLVRVTGREREHTVTLMSGSPVYTIARVAVEQRAALLVVGLGRHQLVDRVFSDETALQLARVARVPVLAVPAEAGGGARHAIVAVDFSELSVRAAQAAVEAVGDTGRVELAHVVPPPRDGSCIDVNGQSYERWVASQLQALCASLVVPEGVTMTTVVLHGRPAPELLAYARRAGADLVATGTHGRGFVARALLGSVTTQLIRAAQVAVLTIPRDPLPALSSSAAGARCGVARQGPAEWAPMLADFTARNLGRRTVLEVDDMEIGAQAQEENYPLIAVMYDTRDRRLQFMLGDRTLEGRHLSRSIGNVSTVDVLTDATGRDVALRVEHGSGQTLLSFAS